MLQPISRVLQVSLLGCLCALAGWTSTVTSVSCISPGAALSTGSSACQAYGTNGYTTATATAMVTLPASAAQAALIQTDSTVTGLQTTAHGIAAYATVTTNTDVSILFDTTGALRSGILQLTFTQDAWQASNSLIHELLSVASYSVAPTGASLATVYIPIELGTSFVFDYQQTIYAIADSLSGMVQDQIAADITLNAFESNGVTPVQLFDPPGVPEPGSIGLTITAMLTATAVLLGRRAIN